MEVSKDSNRCPFTWKFVVQESEKKRRLLGDHTNPFNLSFYELRTSIPASPYEYLVKAVCSTCTSAAFVGMQRPHDVQVPGPTNSNIQWEVHHSKQKLKRTSDQHADLVPCLEWRQKLQKHHVLNFWGIVNPGGKKKESPVRPLHNSLDSDLNLHQIPKQKHSCPPLV